MSGLWDVTVISEYYDPSGKYHRFESSFTIDLFLGIDDQNANADLSNQSSFNTADVDLELDEFEGIVIEDVQKEKDRPVPYIADFTPTGQMTIKWDRLMKPYERPDEIPPTKVAIDLDVYEAEM